MYKKIIVLACIVSISLSGYVFAATQLYSQWNGTDGGDWSTASNWTTNLDGVGQPSTVPVAYDTPGVHAAPFFKAGFKQTTNSPGITTGVTVAADQIVVGGSVSGTLTISGGTVNVSEFVNIGNAATPEKGILNMNGGTINCGTMLPAEGRLMVGLNGQGTLNMNNGTINAVGRMSIAEASTQVCFVHLDGGTINAADLLMNGANAHLDIRGGTLILDGDKTVAIDGFVSSGKLTAYAGSGGTVQRSYNSGTNKTTVTGFLPSSKAINPSPFNIATNVVLDATLSWTAGLGAASHNIYFGTTSPGASQGNKPLTPATFDPGTLAPATTYYWRIDEVNGPNTVNGDVWSFATISGQPTSPSPANFTSGVAIHPTLSWTSGPGALSHNVYFGTTSPGTSQGNQTATTFDPGNLLPNIIYYWRIDEVYGSSTVIGPVWRFTTANTKASTSGSQFSPPDTWTNVPISGLTLIWTPGIGAVSHDVYFGTANPPTSFQGNQTATTFTLPTLSPSTTYYWRIDEKDGAGGTTTGDVWSFTTGAPVVVCPYLTWKSDPTTTITVNWWNPAATGDSSVDYGLTDGYGSTVNVPALTRYHHVEVTGLIPATEYHYRIRSSDGTTGSDNTFTTAAANTTSFSFVMFGDPRGQSLAVGDEPYYTRQKAICDWMAAQHFTFALQGGDTVWEGASLVAMGKWWPDYFYLERNLSKSTVTMTTLGNHECQGGGAYWNYEDFYNGAYPTNGMAGTNGRTYSFDYGNAHFVCLASSQVNVPAQAIWLAADLAAAKARGIMWIFAWWHEPAFTTNTTHPNRVDLIQNWGPIFDQYGVNAVFQSHNHMYERFHALNAYYDNVTNPTSPVWTGKIMPDGEGTVYITNGAGGAEFNNGNPDPKLVCWYGAANLNATIATVVTINGDTCTVQAIRNDTGAVLDTFTLLPRMLKADCNKDSVIDMQDFECIAEHWLDTGIWP